jgi:GR25 family glycosyltransferase involved in LPS biosynthesis
LRSFIISAVAETARAANINQLRNQLPDTIMVEAIYPSTTKVPFLEKLINLSKTRTGKALLPAEIGCLLSHRNVWQKIIQMDIADAEHCLILESDSAINDIELLKKFFSKDKFDSRSTNKITNNYTDINIDGALQLVDLFFFGAWLGHMKLFRSSTKQLNNRYSIGEPFIKTAYCTYGYSINKKAAAYLLQQTKKIVYPARHHSNRWDSSGIDQCRRFGQLYQPDQCSFMATKIIHAFTRY